MYLYGCMSISFDLSRHVSFLLCVRDESLFWGGSKQGSQYDIDSPIHHPKPREELQSYLPSTSSFRIPSLKSLHSRQERYEACITTEVTATWLGPDYSTPSIHCSQGFSRAIPQHSQRLRTIMWSRDLRHNHALQPYATTMSQHFHGKPNQIGGSFPFTSRSVWPQSVFQIINAGSETLMISLLLIAIRHAASRLHGIPHEKNFIMAADIYIMYYDISFVSS